MGTKHKTTNAKLPFLPTTLKFVMNIHNKKSCKKFLCNIFYKFQFFQWQSLKNAQNM